MTFGYIRLQRSFFFRHMSEVKDLKKLTIRGTNVLLLEMPFDVWRIPT